jgi:hypothetical protein
MASHYREINQKNGAEDQSNFMKVRSAADDATRDQALRPLIFRRATPPCR